MNTKRMNRLEELGRVDAEKAFTKKGARNLRDEKKRIVRELKATGGYITKKEKPTESGSKYIQRKPKYITKKKKTGPYITKKKKYITKKTPEQIREREMVRSSRGYKMGGSLKPVNPKTQKGLSKLPRKVRNKMGYMKKGGRVGMGKAMRGGGCVR